MSSLVRIVSALGGVTVAYAASALVRLSAMEYEVQGANKRYIDI